MGGTKESSEFADWISDQFKLAELDNIQIAKYNVLASYPREPGEENDFQLLIVVKNEYSWTKYNSLVGATVRALTTTTRGWNFES